MAFDTQIAEISPAQLDQLFEGVTPTEQTTEKGFTEYNNEEPVVQVGTSSSEIPYFDADLLNEDGTIKEVAATEEKKVVETKEVDTKVVESTEDKTEEDKTKPNVDLAQVNGVLKNTVEYLVTTGQWADFEGREDLEVTQEVYAELAAKQNQNTAYEIVNELIDSTGIYGKAILGHIKNGGNPDEIIDLFKEQKALEQIDTTTEEGKQLKIEKYYKDVLGWKSEKVNKTIKRLIEDNEVDTEFTDVEELYNKHYEQKLQATQAENQRREQEVIERQNAFVNDIRQTLESDSSLTERDKKKIATSIFEFKKDGDRKVNAFQAKITEIQKDPKKYIELVDFVMDTENYRKRLQQKEKSNAAVEAFNFIKGNETMTKNKGANIEVTNKVAAAPAYKGTNFSFTKK